MVNLTALASQLQGRQGVDPKLYSILTQIAAELDALKNPIPIQASLVFDESNLPVSPTEFSVSFTKTHVILNWNDSENADLYDVREGADWENAERVALTPTSFLTLNPTNVGEHTFLIGTKNLNGESADRLIVTFSIPPIGYLEISSNVLDNFVRLSWTIPISTFEIDYYEVKREGILLGRVPATFITHFENVAGAVAYSVIPVDIADNRGPEIIENVIVRSPIDYDLQETRNLTDVATTLLTNVYKGYDGDYLAPVPDETWTEHFTNNSVITIQGLTNLGYNIWAQPNISPGTLVLNFTIPKAFNSVLVETSWETRIIIPSVSIASQLIAGGVTYTGQSIFLNSLPTVFSMTLTFTATGQGIIELLGLKINIIIKKAQDSGHISASSSDRDGTDVSFYRTYLEAPDVAAVVVDTGSYFTTINSITATGFKVKVFDKNGNRASKIVEWLSRGIV